MTSVRHDGSGGLIPPEVDYRLDRLLEQWWQYERDYRAGPRSVRASSVYGMSRSRQRTGYETAEDMLADSIDHVVMDAVASSVDSLPRQHREAIEIRMLNALTSAVWRSNRMSADLVEQLYGEAKALLLPMLRRRRVEI